MSDQAENANDRYERLAEQFYRDTGGIMAPGKDVPAAVGGGLRTDPEFRRELWDIWMRLRPHTAPRELVGEPEAWLIEHSFTDHNGDMSDGQIFCFREEAEEKRQDLIILWLDEQPESVTEAPDDLYPIIPLYRAALSAQEPKVCEWGFRKFNSTLNPNIYINCKNEPIVAMYYDLSAKPFCPYCGGVIKVKE